jgi:tetratricopeptide (TPR) repeat protein
VVLPLGLLALVAVSIWYFVFREAGAERAARLMTEAQQAVQAGDFATAEARLRELQRDAPGSPVVHHNLAILYVQMGRDAEARQEFQQAADLAGPEGGEVRAEELFQLASLSYKQGNWPQVAAELESAIAAHPTRVQLHTRLLDLQLRKLGDRAAADSTTARFLRLCGRTPGSLYDAAYVNHENRAYQPAAELAAEALALSDTLIGAHVLLARSTAELGRPGEALAYLQAQLERFPRAAELWLTRGHVLQGQGGYAQSLAAADHVLSLDSNDYRGHQLRAIALASLGRNAEALREVQLCKTMTRDPNEQRRLAKLESRLVAAQGGSLPGALAPGDSLGATP